MTAAPLPAEPVALASVVAQLAAELRMLGKTLGAVEHAVEILVASAGTPDSRTLHGLQTIDLLGQTLLALATFAEELSPQIPMEVRIDANHAVRSVTLSALAERLRLTATRVTEDLASADLEIFG
jgi:hypothetical protein